MSVKLRRINTCRKGDEGLLRFLQPRSEVKCVDTFGGISCLSTVGLRSARMKYKMFNAWSGGGCFGTIQRAGRHMFSTVEVFHFLYLLSELQGVETRKYTVKKTLPLKWLGFGLDDRQIRFWFYRRPWSTLPYSTAKQYSVHPFHLLSSMMFKGCVTEDGMKLIS
jgi:hypothetical protein